MRSEMFATPSLDARPRPAKAEPEFRLRSAPRSEDPTATSNPRTLLGTEDAGEMPVRSTQRTAVSRRATDDVLEAQTTIGAVGSTALFGKVPTSFVPSPGLPRLPIGSPRLPETGASGVS